MCWFHADPGLISGGVRGAGWISFGPRFWRLSSPSGALALEAKIDVQMTSEKNIYSWQTL